MQRATSRRKLRRSKCACAGAAGSFKVLVPPGKETLLQLCGLCSFRQCSVLLYFPQTQDTLCSSFLRLQLSLRALEQTASAQLAFPVLPSTRQRQAEHFPLQQCPLLAAGSGRRVHMAMGLLLVKSRVSQQMGRQVCWTSLPCHGWPCLCPVTGHNCGRLRQIPGLLCRILSFTHVMTASGASDNCRYWCQPHVQQLLSRACSVCLTGSIGFMCQAGAAQKQLLCMDSAGASSLCRISRLLAG